MEKQTIERQGGGKARKRYDNPVLGVRVWAQDIEASYKI